MLKLGGTCFTYKNEILNLQEVNSTMPTQKKLKPILIFYVQFSKDRIYSKSKAWKCDSTVLKYPQEIKQMDNIATKKMLWWKSHAYKYATSTRLHIRGKQMKISKATIKAGLFFFFQEKTNHLAVLPEFCVVKTISHYYNSMLTLNREPLHIIQNTEN